MNGLTFAENETSLQGEEAAGLSAEALVQWAGRTYRDSLALTSSFGSYSAVMLHMVTTHAPGTQVILIDTGYLFPETYQFAESLRKRLGFSLTVTRPELSAAHQEALYGREWENGEEGIKRYLERNKVAPLRRVLEELGIRAWIAGLRSGQTEHRANLSKLDEQDGRQKIHPILDWSQAEVDAYLKEHDLPLHPLVAEGYRSIGDVHSTLPTTPEMDPRDGRLLGKKRECGIHLSAQDRSLKSSGL